MAEQSDIQKFLEGLSKKLENQREMTAKTDGDGGINLDDPAVKKWRKRQLEEMAKAQGRIARCPNCDYIVPLTGLSGQAGAGKLFCAICKKEFDELAAQMEAQKYKQYEEWINKALEAAGFNGRILDLRRSPQGGELIFYFNSDFEDELKSKRERIKNIFDSIIPENDRK